MPLQPTDVPSRAGIQAAIDEAVNNHASTIDVNSQHYDSGWITLPLRAGFVFNSETPRYRRVGKVVQIVGRVGPSGGGNMAAGTYTVADIPAGFRTPILNLVYAGGFQSSAIYGRLYTGSNGAINIQIQQASANASLAMMYLID